MYTVSFAIERVVLFKDVHGVAIYCDMDHCCNYTKKPMTLKLCCLLQEHGAIVGNTQNYAYYIFALLWTQKEY